MRRSGFSIQLLVSVALLVWIFWKEDFRVRTWQVLTSRTGMVGGGIPAAGVGNLVGVVRWDLSSGLVFSYSPGRVPAEFCRPVLQHFPLVGAVGGDAVKVVWLVAKGHRKTAAVLSVVMDRMSGLGR